MKKNVKRSLTALFGLGLTLQFYQNCNVASMTGTKPLTKVASAAVQSTCSAPAVSVPLPNGVITDPNSGIVQLQGHCAPGCGDVVIANSGNVKNTATCDATGGFQGCSLALALRINNLTVAQASAQTTVPVFSSHPIDGPSLAILTVKVNNPASGTIGISCMPAAAISATIYGVQQLAANATCPTTGILTFDVGLVPSLASSGQRVVYVNQTTQAGSVTMVSTDVDNTDPAHTCSIDFHQPNSNICVNAAGTISGSCKAGLPVSISVNGVLQQSVTCKGNKVYSATNVLLENPGASNVISISQVSPFGTHCEASLTLSNF